MDCRDYGDDEDVSDGAGDEHDNGDAGDGDDHSNANGRFSHHLRHHPQRPRCIITIIHGPKDLIFA